MSSGRGNRKVEAAPEIEEFTFEEFQETLKKLRRDLSEIILGNTNRPDNLPSTKEKNYDACVVNLRQRMDLFDKFYKHLSDQELKWNTLLREKKDVEENRIEVMQLKNKLKNLDFFKLSLDAERKREEFYKREAIKIYMKNYLEIIKGPETS